MGPRPFEPTFESLPVVLPVFPLSGALLLPRCRLPLNIFEPCYLQMTEDALAGDRLIGMVQPRDPEPFDHRPDIFPTGCAGRISSFSETDDGRMLIILTGVSRFDVESELGTDSPYRQIVPRWDRYRSDLIEQADGAIDRERLYASLRVYFESRDLDTDWEMLEEATDEHLINSLAMSCPFGRSERQALLEAGDVTERGRLMLALLDMATLDQVGGELPLQ